MTTHSNNQRRSPAGRSRKRWALFRLLWRWTVSYKNFTMRQSWPLRVVLGIVGAVLAIVVLMTLYELIMMAIAIAVVVGIFLVLGAFGKLGSGSGDDEYYQMMSDAAQREHEDRGMV